METTTLEDVLRLARQLTPSDQAKLAEQLAPVIDATATVQDRTATSNGHKLSPHAAQLAADPDSTLARALRIANAGTGTYTNEDIQRLREERLSERYGV